MGWFGRSSGLDADDPRSAREAMVRRQIASRGISDASVLEAMREVPRSEFVPERRRREALADAALPIGHGQTISQPYIVASMTSALEPRDGARVLEVGTGSGYQAAVLAACGMEVFSVERIPELLEEARGALERAGYADRVRLRLGDGSKGWPEEAPFDRILVTAAAERVPPALVEQLGPGGILVAPVGGRTAQTIVRLRRAPGGAIERERLERARFVPLVEDEA
ncbi:MAG TPA: protein-L-isoaspartate(D-aspartate) O-methyltransferase [Gemmatimonadota bacterium]|nr:protein-L-isoaspartate(D-aspartate) O-methyltransferase [Gemmatimonadota bacterium]